MQVFERGSKVNFVDENNVFLGYDINQECCEYADWFIADTPMATIPPKREGIPDLKEFVFDTAFFEQVDGAEFEGGEQDFDRWTKMVIFRIVNGDSEKFIHIYNSHNGYYAHGFDFTVDGRVNREGRI